MMQHRHAVTDFVWTDGRFLQPADLARELDLFGGPDPAPRARRLWGQFALHLAAGDEHVLVRDPLGVNKLFFAIDARGEVVSSSYWIDLVRAGHAASAIWSVPSGRVLRVDPARRRLELTPYAALPFNGDPGVEPGAEDAARIRRALDATFERLRAAVAGRPLHLDYHSYERKLDELYGD
jgi:asparagine synthetase B (glutamine-hydrolysing)